MFTPTASSQFVAGVGLWSVIWSGIFKLDEIARMLRIGKLINRDRLLSWINAHKAISIVISEVINFGWHGTNSGNAVMFALGGTFTNLVMIMFVLPIRSWRRAKRLAKFSI